MHSYPFHSFRGRTYDFSAARRRSLLAVEPVAAYALQASEQRNILEVGIFEIQFEYPSQVVVRNSSYSDLTPNFSFYFFRNEGLLYVANSCSFSNYSSPPLRLIVRVHSFRRRIGYAYTFS